MRATFVLLAFLAPSALVSPRAELLLAPGQPLALEHVTELLRPALDVRQDGGDGTIDIVQPALPLPNRATSPVKVDLVRIRREAAGGRFAATLRASLDSGESSTIEIAGEVIETGEVAVLVARKRRSEPLAATDIQVRRLPLHVLPREPLTVAEIGPVSITARALPAGHILRRGDLADRALVAAGDTVELVHQRPGLFLAVKAMALDSGNLGDRVRVRANEGQEVRSAVVVGPRRVAAQTWPEVH